MADITVTFSWLNNRKQQQKMAAEGTSDVYMLLKSKTMSKKHLGERKVKAWEVKAEYSFNKAG